MAELVTTCLCHFLNLLFYGKRLQIIQNTTLIKESQELKGLWCPVPSIICCHAFVRASYDNDSKVHKSVMLNVKTRRHPSNTLRSVYPKKVRGSYRVLTQQSCYANNFFSETVVMEHELLTFTLNPGSFSNIRCSRTDIFPVPRPDFSSVVSCHQLSVFGV